MTNFYKCLKDYVTIKEGEVVLNYFPCHDQLVVMPSATNRIEYNRANYLIREEFSKNLKQLLEQGYFRPLEKWEVAKLANHMTWRIWRMIGALELNRRKGEFGFAFDVLNEIKGVNIKPRLLPQLMCYDCMKEGNPFLTKIPKQHSRGSCIICGEPKWLHITMHAWPVNFPEKGFGSTVGMQFEHNRASYAKSFQEEQWWGTIKL